MNCVLCLLLSLLLTRVAFAQGDSKHGTPISLHPQNPHYFLFHDHALVLIGSGEHYGAVLNGDFDYAKYLAKLDAEGMNYTRLFGGSYVEVPAKSFGILRNDLAPASGRFVAPWARSGTAGYSGGGNKFDLENWNPEYFTRCTGSWQRLSGAESWWRLRCSLRSMPRLSGQCRRSIVLIM